VAQTFIAVDMLPIQVSLRKSTPTVPGSRIERLNRIGLIMPMTLPSRGACVQVFQRGEAAGTWHVPDD
jgi:hypothetical protein